MSRKLLSRPDIPKYRTHWLISRKWGANYDRLSDWKEPIGNWYSRLWVLSTVPFAHLSPINDRSQLIKQEAFGSQWVGWHGANKHRGKSMNNNVNSANRWAFGPLRQCRIQVACALPPLALFVPPQFSHMYTYGWDARHITFDNETAIYQMQANVLWANPRCRDRR